MQAFGARGAHRWCAAVGVGRRPGTSPGRLASHRLRPRRSNRHPCDARHTNRTCACCGNLWRTLWEPCRI